MITYLIDNECQSTCPADWNLEYPNICTQESSWDTAKALFLPLPCLYVYLACAVLLLAVKGIRKDRVSLVMTNLLLVSCLLTCALILQTVFNFTTTKSGWLDWLVTLTPMLYICANLLVNLWVTLVYKTVLAISGLQVSRWVCWPSALLSYHILSQVSIQQTD